MDDDVEHERFGLIEAIKNLAFLIEQSQDFDEIVRYAEQLQEFKARLVALGPPPPKTKSAKKS